MDWRERIEENPKDQHGEPRIRGTKVFVSHVLDELTAHLDFRDVLASHPGLSEDDVRACVAWAAHVAKRIAEPDAGGAPETGGFKEFLRAMPNLGDDADFERPLDYGRPEIEWDT